MAATIHYKVEHTTESIRSNPTTTTNCTFCIQTITNPPAHHFHKLAVCCVLCAMILNHPGSRSRILYTKWIANGKHRMYDSWWILYCVTLYSIAKWAQIILTNNFCEYARTMMNYKSKHDLAQADGHKQVLPYANMPCCSCESRIFRPKGTRWHRGTSSKIPQQRIKENPISKQEAIIE